MAEKKESDNKNDDESILAIARERFQLVVEAESEIRKLQLDDMKFLSGEQWPDGVKQSRELDRRPCLTINRLTQSVHQVTNDQRQNRPSIKVNPVDDKATVETAKVFQGIIRHIEYNSNADIAYDTAFEHAAAGGRGWLRVVTDYCDPKSFDQDIFIKRVRNCFSVYLDPNYQEPDGSDANFGFIVDSMAPDDFKAQFPDAELSQMEDWESLGDRAPGWVSKGSCRIAEYFFKTFKEITLVKLSNGEIKDEAELPDPMPESITVVETRKAILPAIKWYKINGLEVLEKTDWLGQWIPILPVIGDEMDIDGTLSFKGIVRDAKDPQRMYNYWASAETETIALAPKAPFIGYAGQFEGYEGQWKTANIRNHAYLEVNPKTISGQLPPLPTRNVFEAPVQAITQARMQSADDLKVTTGIYDATLGNRSNEQSGTAIQRRNAQSQTSNFHLMDNMSRTQRHLGRILIDLIPKIYNEPQAVRTIAEDGEVEMVMINQIFKKDGKDMYHDMSAGKYDVTISSGPSFETKRQEAVASMSDLTRAYPPLMQYAGDLMVRNMDWPGAPEIADRLKAMLPPNLQNAGNKDQQPIPPQVQAQMQQMQQMNQELIQHLQEKTQIINQKTLELQSKERIELARIEADIGIALARTGSSDAQALLKHQVSAIQHRLDLDHENQQIEGSGAMSAANPQQQQEPTGGLSPGQSMGAQP